MLMDYDMSHVLKLNVLHKLIKITEHVSRHLCCCAAPKVMQGQLQYTCLSTTDSNSEIK